MNQETIEMANLTSNKPVKVPGEHLAVGKTIKQCSVVQHCFLLHQMLPLFVQLKSFAQVYRNGVVVHACHSILELLQILQG